MFKWNVGERVVRRIPAKYKVKNPVLTGTITEQIPDMERNDGKRVRGYRIRFDGETEGEYAYCEKGDFLEDFTTRKIIVLFPVALKNNSGT